MTDERDVEAHAAAEATHEGTWAGAALEPHAAALARRMAAVSVQLEDLELWRQFEQLGTELLVSKRGLYATSSSWRFPIVALHNGNSYTFK